MENCQIGVFLAYRSDAGCALIDRELYLPQEWTADRARCQQAGVPAGRTFLTKIQLAGQMLQRVLAAGVPFAWVTGDNVYSAAALRSLLEQENRNYVLACDRTRKLWQGDSQRTAKVLAGERHASCWRTITLAPGSRGQRQHQYQARQSHYKPRNENPPD